MALNRALAVAERDGIDAGRRELIALAWERKLSRVIGAGVPASRMVRRPMGTRQMGAASGVNARSAPWAGGRLG